MVVEMRVARLVIGMTSAAGTGFRSLVDRLSLARLCGWAAYVQRGGYSHFANRKS